MAEFIDEDGEELHINYSYKISGGWIGKIISKKENFVEVRSEHNGELHRLTDNNFFNKIKDEEYPIIYEPKIKNPNQLEMFD